VSEKTQDVLPRSDLGGQTRSLHHSVLRVYDVFVNVEGLQIRVPKPLFGFIPFSVNRKFGLYVVMMLAAPESSDSAFLLSLAKAALAEEFAPISRNSVNEWQTQQIDCREVGAAPPIIQQPDCINQEWGALWYELGDESAKLERYELAKTRLWEEGFTVSRSSSVPI